MSATAARNLAEPQKRSKTRDNVAPGEKSLYYKNVGLFSDPYLESLPKTRGDSFILQNWDTFDTHEFNECYEWMLSTWSDLKDILPKLSEDQLRAKWIDPILERLGWESQVEEEIQRWGKAQRPDYSLFESKSVWKKAQGCPNRDEGYFKHITAICEAKEMGVPLDAAKLNNTNPSFQIISYLVATGKDWGILTDGRYWRLYSTKSKSSFRAYFEVNVEKFLGERDDDQFLYFYNFFRKLAFLKDATTNQSFLDVVFESGEHYAREVETKLKERAFELVELIAQGFASENQPKSEQELRVVYEHSLYFLFRLLFILNCEAKGLLSVHRTSDYYPYSLRSLCLRIKQEREANQTWARVAKSYNHITDLFQLLTTGDESIGLHGFGKEVFSSGDRAFYKNNPIPDSHLNKVLLALAFAEFGKKKELRFIDYKRLSADHLGSVFEGLLEYKLAYESNGKVKEVALVNAGGERKTSGSYYTPEHIVDYIVKETLEPIVRRTSIDDILELKVIDPAMGSGHFLLGAVRYLEQAILTKLNESGGGREFEQGVNWAVLHSCIFGIDKNPMAVELAKFSLWMYTAKNGYELEPLSDQLICADALLDPTDKNVPLVFGPIGGIDLSKIEALKKSKGKFDVVVGNPPYAPISDRAAHDFYTAKFLHQDYQLDLYLLFLERYEHFIKDNGRLGVIVSNTWLQSVKLRKLREYLCKTYRWDKILHSEDKLFDATVDTHALIFTLGDAKKGHDVQIDVLRDGVVERLHNISSDRLPKSGDPVNILANSEIADIFSSLQKRARPVSDFCDVVTGVKPFQKGKGRPAQTAEIMEKKPFVVEGHCPTGKDWMPLLRGSLIQRYSLLWNKNYWIKYGPWLAEPRDRSVFDAPAKIVVRQTGDSIIGTIIKGGMVARDNLYLILPKSERRVDLHLLLGVLNSALVDFYYYNMNPEKGEALAQVKRAHVAGLPFIDYDELDKKHSSIADRISENVKKAISKSGKIDCKLLNEIDCLVFDLFDVSKADREAIMRLCGSFKRRSSDQSEAA